MSRRLVIQYGGDPLIVAEIPNEGALLVRGTTVPSDGATGYAKGCLFVDTDASAGSVLYVNEGSNASADFNLALADETVALVEGVTAGTWAVSKACTLNSSGDATLVDGTDLALGTTTGTKIGTATAQKLGFWNATPIVQPASADQAALAAYGAGANGLDSGANMAALHALVVAMRTALVNAGIMKGAA